MKILLTGSEGQLGRDIAPRLITAGHTVIGHDVATLDITDAKKTADLIKEVAPKVIINCAAYTAVDKAEKERDAAFAVNATGPENIAKGAKAVGAALIHISTDFVFDGKKSTPYNEEDAVNPIDVYGESKLKGEQAVIRNLPEHVIIRTAWLYGSQGANFVKTILKHAADKEVMKVVYDQAGTPTWTADLCDAIIAAANSIDAGEKRFGVYHYSNEGVTSWYDFALASIEEARVLGVSLKIKHMEPILTHEYPTPAKRPAYSVLDKKKIKDAFRIIVPHWRESLKKMLKELYGG